jgi:hypothetical protein
MKIEELADAYLRNDLSEAQRAKVIEILKEDDEQSRDFVEHLYETGQMIDAAEQISQISSHLDELELPPKASPIWKVIVACSAIAAALIVLFIVPFNSTQSQDDLSVEVFRNKVLSLTEQASIARIHSVKGDSFQDGQWLEKGKYTFADKTALTFDSGVELNLEKGSVLDLLGANEARLISGKVSALVPEVAIGFILHTPSSEILDLGTEFAVQVDDQGSTEVEVLVGEVELTPKASDTQKLLLRKNDRMQVQRSGRIDRDIEALTPVELLPNDLEKRELTYVHWTFDEGQAGVSPALSFPDANLDFSAQLLERGKKQSFSQGPELVDGVFGKALKFDGVNDVAETDYRGVGGSKARTVSVWIRVPPKVGLDQNYAVVSWGNATQNNEKWQLGWNAISRDGNLGAIRTEFRNGYVIGQTDLRDGKWHHVVSLFIGGENADVATHVRHYVDGKLESVSGYKRAKIHTNLDDINSQAVSFGRKMDGPRKFLKAKLDELYIIESAVTPGQIRQLKNKNSLK